MHSNSRLWWQRQNRDIPNRRRSAAAGDDGEPIRLSKQQACDNARIEMSNYECGTRDCSDGTDDDDTVPVSDYRCIGLIMNQILSRRPADKVPTLWLLSKSLLCCLPRVGSRLDSLLLLLIIMIVRSCCRRHRHSSPKGNWHFE